MFKYTAIKLFLIVSLSCTILIWLIRIKTFIIFRYNTIKEGYAEILFSDNEKEVFYNPAQLFSRDITFVLYNITIFYNY